MIPSKDGEVQAEMTLVNWKNLKDELNNAYQKMKVLKKDLAAKTTFSEEILKSNKEVQFYTGLSNSGLVKVVFHILAPQVRPGLKLSHF